MIDATARPPRTLPRRGTAMLLVLVSLLTATVVATAYLASRDNSSIIGDNVSDATSARWAAAAGLEIGVAIVQTERDWRTAHTGGRLLEGYPLDRAEIDLDLVDLATGAPPDERSRYVEIRVTARSGGVAQAASTEVTVPLAGTGRADFGDFAVYVGNKLHMRDQATIARWPSAALSELGKRLAIGTRSTGAGTIKLENDAAAVDATVYHGPGASAALVLNASGPPIRQVELPDTPPMPAPEAPPVPAPGGPDYPDLKPSSPITISADRRYDKIEPDGASGVITLDGDITVVAEDRLRLRDGSGIFVDGNVTLVVFGELEIDPGSFLELRPDATLTLFLHDEVELDQAYLGDVRVDRSARDTSGKAQYMDPRRLRIIVDDAGGGGGAATVVLADPPILTGSPVLDTFSSDAGAYGGANVGPAPTVETAQAMPGLSEPVGLPYQDEFKQDGGGTVVLSASVHCSSFEVGNGTRLQVDGRITVLVDDRLVLQNLATIELLPGATLDLYFKKDATIQDVSSLNVDTADPSRVRLLNLGSTDWTIKGDAQAYATVVSPGARLSLLNGADLHGTYTGRALTIDGPAGLHVDLSAGAGGGADWRVEGDSVIKGTIYAPGSAVTLHDSAAIYGNVAADRLTMRDGSSLFYDHGLDTQEGLTNAESPLYGADGHILDAYLTLASFDGADLTAAADAAGVRLAYADLVSGTPAPTADTPAGEPTPRPIEVGHDLKTLGSAVADWEARAR